MSSLSYSLPISELDAQLASFGWMGQEIAPTSVAIPLNVRSPTSSNLVPDLIREFWYRISKSGLPEPVFNELLRLALPTEEREQVSRGALASFLALWEMIGDDAGVPVVSGTTTGNLVAEWFHEPENSLVIMFDKAGRFHFSLFRDALPLEGIREPMHLGDTVTLLRSAGVDPFTWSDVNGEN